MNPLNPMNKVSYAVIGGCGFLGQHLVHTLLEKHRPDETDIHIKVIDKTSHTNALMYPKDFAAPCVQLCLNVDITKATDCADLLQDVDTVFILAAAIAYGRKNKALLQAVNVTGIQNILTSAKQAKVKKLIYVSSIATLGCINHPDTEKLANESCENDWQKETYCHYGLSKYHAEQMVLAQGTDTLQVAVAAPGLLMGPGYCCFANQLPFHTALKRNWALIPEGGSNYIDVRDVATGLIALAHGKSEGKYLLVANNITHKNLLQKIAKHTKRHLKLWEIPQTLGGSFALLFSLLEFILPATFPLSKEGMTKAFKYRYYSNQRLQTLGWAPNYSLEKTIQDTLYWMRENNHV